MRKFDYGQYKDYPWDNETIDLLIQIHRYKEKQELYLKGKPDDVLENMAEIAKVQSIEDSNRIEGIVAVTTTISDLFNEKSLPKTEAEKEILGYLDVVNLIQESYPHISMSKNHILQLHRDLYRYSEKEAGGSFKIVQNSIIETYWDGTVRERFRPLSPLETPGAVDQICIELNQALEHKDVDELLLIPVFIHDFLCIHPFNDGNGRMSRLLMTLLLYRQGYVVGKYISLESKIENHQERYYHTLNQSGQGWHDNREDISHFVKYFLFMLLASYTDFEKQLNISCESVKR